jgi:hypothetical protein
LGECKGNGIVNFIAEKEAYILLYFFGLYLPCTRKLEICEATDEFSINGGWVKVFQGRWGSKIEINQLSEKIKQTRIPSVKQ